MADTTYSPKVYKKNGGDVLVVANGGELLIETGGTITNEGTTYVVTEPDDVTLEINGSDEIAVKAEGIDTAQLSAGVVALLDLLSDLPVENVAAPGIWNDNGVLKVGTAT
jgi:hypothetical protein